MAFSTTRSVATLRPGVEVATITLADTSGDSGAIGIENAESVSIQMANSGTNGTTTVQVSNDGTTYAALPTNISFTGSGLKFIQKNDLGARFLRLNLATGDGTTSHTATIVICRRN